MAKSRLLRVSAWGSQGVNLVETPLLLHDEELTHAQNAELPREEGEPTIRKRLGMTSFTSGLATPVHSLYAVPLPAPETGPGPPPGGGASGVWIAHTLYDFIVSTYDGTWLASDGSFTFVNQARTYGVRTFADGRVYMTEGGGCAVEVWEASGLVATFGVPRNESDVPVLGGFAWDNGPVLESACVWGNYVYGVIYEQANDYGAYVNPDRAILVRWHLSTGQFEEVSSIWVEDATSNPGITQMAPFSSLCVWNGKLWASLGDAGRPLHVVDRLAVWSHTGTLGDPFVMEVIDAGRTLDEAKFRWLLCPGGTDLYLGGYAEEALAGPSTQQGVELWKRSPAGTWTRLRAPTGYAGDASIALPVYAEGNVLLYVEGTAIAPVAPATEATLLLVTYYGSTDGGSNFTSLGSVSAAGAPTGSQGDRIGQAFKHNGKAVFMGYGLGGPNMMSAWEFDPVSGALVERTGVIGDSRKPYFIYPKP